MERDNIAREIIQSSYHPKNVFFQRNSSLIRSLHYYHDNVQKLNKSKPNGPQFVNQLKDLNVIEDSVQNQTFSPSNSVSSLQLGSSFVRETTKTRTKANGNTVTGQAASTYKEDDSPRSNTREGFKLPSLSADQRADDSLVRGGINKTRLESSTNDIYNFQSSFEKRYDSNTKITDKVLNTTTISLFGMKKCTCCNLYDDKDEFMKKYLKGMVKSKNISSLKSSVNFADYMDNFNQDVSHLMDKKKVKKSEDRRTEKFMSTINTFYKERNKIGDFKENEIDDKRQEIKIHHARGKSEDIAKNMTLELKKEIPNSMTPVPSGRQEASKLKSWVIEKENTLMDSMKEASDKGELLKQLKNLYKIGTQELIRQINTECTERGDLLLFIWKRIESLIESHVKNLNYFKEKIKGDADNLSSTIVGVVEKRINDKDIMIQELKETIKKKEKAILSQQNEIKEGNQLAKTLRDKINTRNKAILIYKDNVRILQNQNQQFRNRIEQLRNLDNDKTQIDWPEEDATPKEKETTPRSSLLQPGELKKSKIKIIVSDKKPDGKQGKRMSNASDNKNEGEHRLSIIKQEDLKRTSLKRSSLQLPQYNEKARKSIINVIDQESLPIIEEGSKETLEEEDLAPNIELGAIDKPDANHNNDEWDEQDDKSSAGSQKELLKDEEVDELIINAVNGESGPKRRGSFIKLGELNSVFSFCMPDRVPETRDVDTYVHPSDLPESHSEQGVQTKLVLIDKKFDNLTKNAYIFEDLLNDFLYKKEFENMMVDDEKMLNMEHGEDFLKVISEINKVASNIKGQHEEEEKPANNMLDQIAEKHIQRQASVVGKIMVERKNVDVEAKGEMETITEEEIRNKPRSKTAHMQGKGKSKKNVQLLLPPTSEKDSKSQMLEEKKEDKEESEKHEIESVGISSESEEEEENDGPIKPKLKDIVNRLKRSKNKMIELNKEAKEGQKGEGSSTHAEKKTFNKNLIKSLIPADENASKRQNFKLLIGFNKTMNEMKNTVKRAIRLYMAEKFKSKQFEDQIKVSKDTTDREKKEKTLWEAEKLLLQQRILELEFMTKGADISNQELSKFNESRRMAATQFKFKPDAATLIQFKARAPKLLKRKIHLQDGPANNVSRKRQQDQTGSDIVSELKAKGVSDFHNFMPLKVLLRHISQMYADKIQLKKESNQQEFPDFVYNFMLKYYGFKKIAQQKFIVFLLSLRKQLVLLRVQNMAKFMNLLETANYNKADNDKYIDMLEFFITDRTYINNEADSKYLIPFTKAWEYVKSFLEGKISPEELHDFKREVDNLKEFDQKTGTQKLILIDIDVLFVKFLTKYKNVMNATKDFAIKVFRAVDLYGSNMCSIGEFLLLAKHIESEFFKIDDSAEKMFYEYSDVELENERYLSLEKFTNLCAEKDLFSDAQQLKFLELRGNLEIPNLFKQIQERWSTKTKEIESRLEKLGLLDEKIAEDWRALLDIVGQRMVNGTEEVKSTLLAYKIINGETQRLIESQGIE